MTTTFGSRLARRFTQQMNPCLMLGMNGLSNQISTGMVSATGVGFPLVKEGVVAWGH